MSHCDQCRLSKPEKLTTWFVRDDGRRVHLRADVGDDVSGTGEWAVWSVRLVETGNGYWLEKGERKRLAAEAKAAHAARGAQVGLFGGEA